LSKKNNVKTSTAASCSLRLSRFYSIQRRRHAYRRDVAAVSPPHADWEAPQTRGSREHPRRLPAAGPTCSSSLLWPAESRLASPATEPSGPMEGRGRSAPVVPMAGGDKRRWRRTSSASSPWPVGTSDAGDEEAPPRPRGDVAGLILELLPATSWTTSSSYHRRQRPCPPADGDHTVSQHEAPPTSFSR
jgi:hypothetical protein